MFPKLWKMFAKSEELFSMLKLNVYEIANILFAAHFSERSAAATAADALRCQNQLVALPKFNVNKLQIERKGKKRTAACRVPGFR